MATINITADKNINEISYVDGDLLNITGGATLTIDATPPARPLGIQCITSGKLRVINASTTTPLNLRLSNEAGDYRFEGNGVMEVLGDMLEFGTGNGTQQSWDFVTLFDGVYDALTYVEVETEVDSGVYECYPIVEASAFFTTAIGEVGVGAYGTTNLTGIGSVAKEKFAYQGRASKVLFFDSLTRQLSTGDGVTYGSVIPEGLKLRIPNIFIGNVYKGYGCLQHSIYTVGNPTGGTFKLAIYNSLTGTLLGTTANIAHNATSATVDIAIESATGLVVTNSGGALPAAVRINFTVPTVVVVAENNLTGGTTPFPYTRMFEATAMTLLDLSPSGRFKAENCMFGMNIRVTTSTFSSFEAKNVGFGGDVLSLTSTNGNLALEHCSICQSAYTAQGAHSITSIFGDSIIKNNIFTCLYGIAGMSMSTLLGLKEFTGNVIYQVGYGSSTSRYALTATVFPSGIVLEGNHILGGELNLVNMSNISVLNFDICDTVYNTERINYSCNAIVLSNNDGCFIYGVRNGGMTNCRNGYISTDSASKNIIVKNIRLNANNQATSLITFQGKTGVVEDCIVENIRSSGLIVNSSTYLANVLQCKKVFGTMGTDSSSTMYAGQGFEYNGVSVSEYGFREAMVAVENFVGGNFVEYSTSPTRGNITFGAFGANGGLTLTGGAFTDQAGSVFLPKTGDSFIAEIPFLLNGITGFAQDRYQSIVIGDVEGLLSTSHILICPNGANAGNVVLDVYNTSNVLLGQATIAYNASTSVVDSVITPYSAITTVTGTMPLGYDIYTGVKLRFSIASSTLTLNGVPSPVYVYGRTTLTNSGVTDSNQAIYPSTAVASVQFQFEHSLKTHNGQWTEWANGYTASSLQSTFNTLVDYDESLGLGIKIRVTATKDNSYAKVNQMSIPTLINPEAFNTFDAYVTLDGTLEDDVTTLYDYDNDEEIATFVGYGVKQFNVGNYYKHRAYFVRRDSAGYQIMRTKGSAITLQFGNNGVQSLYAGNQVQLADIGAVTTFLANLTTTGANLIDSMSNITSSNSRIENNMHMINRNVIKASKLIPASESMGIN